MEYILILMSSYLLALILVIFVGLVYRNYQQSKQIKNLNRRMSELEVRIVVRLEDRISGCEESIEVLEHAKAINAVLTKQSEQ